MHPDENILLQQLASCSNTAFEQLYELYRLRVFNTVLSYVQQQADAEEVMQDVFLEIYQSAAQFKAQSSPSTWIYRIAVNKSLDRLRYQKRKKRFAFFTSLFHEDSAEPLQELADFNHPGIVLEQKENARHLFAALQTIPAQQKTAFILTYIEELPQKEVAIIMELSVKAVESLLQRAKSNLRKQLEK